MWTATGQWHPGPKVGVGVVELHKIRLSIPLWCQIWSFYLENAYSNWSFIPSFLKPILHCTVSSVHPTASTVYGHLSGSPVEVKTVANAYR
jgi:hypothetical protein